MTATRPERSTDWQNPFTFIKNIPTAKMFIQKWHNKAMKSSTKGVSRSVPVIQRTRRKESHRIDVFALGIRDQIKEIVKAFPDFDELHPFYTETMDILYSLDNVKKALGSLYTAQKIVIQIRGEHMGRIWRGRTAYFIKKERRAALGRISSFVRQLDDRFIFLEKVRTEIKRLPGINPSSPSVVVAGYPNVGKSTFVKTITAAPIQIASYPFTTKEVSIGHLKVGMEKIALQVVDTPGVLDRPIENLKPIELRAIAAIRHLATIVLFLVDPTENCGFELENQLSLLEQIRDILKETPMIIFVNKMDLISNIKQKYLVKQISLRFPKIKILSGSATDAESSHKALEQCLQEKEVIDLILRNTVEIY